MIELNSKQRQIVDALVKTGGSNKVLARELGITLSTVKGRIESVYRRLGVRNRVQLILWAR